MKHMWQVRRFFQNFMEIDLMEAVYLSNRKCLCNDILHMPFYEGTIDLNDLDEWDVDP